MKLSTLQATLQAIGVEPTKSLGQNFLHDQNLAGWIVKQVGLTPETRWVEVGPGLGSLTEMAHERSRHGLLLEKDRRLAAWLGEKFPELEVIEGDAGEWDTRELWVRGVTRVFGNLPYNISSQILFQFTHEPTPVTGMIFTFQRELAERLSAEPRTKDYGALTLLIGRRWRVQLVRTLPPGVFTPVPKVESAVVSLTPRPPGELPDCDPARFTRLVKLGFSQRRKQMRKMLAPEIADWPAAAAHLGIVETARAEELGLEQWIALTRWGQKSGDPAGMAQDVHREKFDIVDAEDHVTGNASRHEVHRQGLWHRAVHILVWNRHGELFLQRRSRWKDVHPLRWDSSAAGHVPSGDTYADTAPRELEEELGVSARMQEIGAVSACAATGWEHVRVYRAEHDGPFTLHPAEIDGGDWFTPEQVDRWVLARPGDFATGFLECWRLCRGGGAQPGPPRNSL